MKKICVFTGSRAEYYILKPLLNEIKKDSQLKLQLVVSGTHLSPEFGYTVKDIVNDNFYINEKIEIILSSDTPISICKSMGLLLISFSESLKRLKPDMLVLLGDRFETFAAAQVAYVSRIPVTHIQGGELSAGAIDNGFRHSITKMSSLHFVYADVYKKRVNQLGEATDTIFNYGALNLDSINKTKKLSLRRLEKKLNFKLGKKNILVTFHSSTLEKNLSRKNFNEILKSIQKIKDYKIIFTKTNADTDGRIINRMIDEFVKKNKENSISFKNLGQERYVSLLKFIDVVIGNSSSGIIETPTFKIPTLNIGARQAGRLKASNIIDVQPNELKITKAFKYATSQFFLKKINKLENPFYKKNTAILIKNKIKSLAGKLNIIKKFVDLK